MCASAMDDPLGVEIALKLLECIVETPGPCTFTKTGSFSNKRIAVGFQCHCRVARNSRSELDRVNEASGPSVCLEVSYSSLPDFASSLQGALSRSKRFWRALCHGRLTVKGFRQLPNGEEAIGKSHWALTVVSEADRWGRRRKVSSRRPPSFPAQSMELFQKL